MSSLPAEAAARKLLDGWAAEHGRAVHGYLRCLTGNADVADDLVQEVFRRAWQARDRYRETGAARAYLLQIADRLACDWVRRRGRERQLDSDDWERVEPAALEEDPAVAVEQGELEGRLDAALARLSTPQRRVILLRYYSEMSFAEIAATIDCPLNTVLSHCRRGLLALRQLLTEPAP